MAKTLAKSAPAGGTASWADPKETGLCVRA